MSDEVQNGRAQFRADLPGEAASRKPLEQEAVRTTIVGGRPPGSGKPLGPIPRGIEVLLKKAAVDPEFRALLLDNPEQAAETIALELDPVERSMLKTMPAAQLAIIIDRTTVPQTQRRAFLGTAAAAMLAALTGIAATVGCTKGIQPDPPAPAGVRPEEYPLPEGGSRPTDPEEEIIDERPDRLMPAPGGAAPDMPPPPPEVPETPEPPPAPGSAQGPIPKP